MAFQNLPKTVALIPDGNRRWARMHSLSVLDGYNLGVKKFIDFGEWCADYGINRLTVWAMSSDNVKRADKEVKTLFSVYKKVANDKDILERLHNTNTHVNIIGNLKLLPTDLVHALHKVEEETSMYTERVINMLMGYGGRDDLIVAAQNYQGTPASFEKSLMSSKVEDLDMIIRTSGEKRLSGFLPWQSYYSELYFSKKLWPDFTKRDLHSALNDYSKRERRFGR